MYAHTLYPNKFMKNTIVGSKMLGSEKHLSERSWVRKGLGPNRLFLLGAKGFGSETSDIPNGDPTDGWTETQPMDGRTD